MTKNMDKVFETSPIHQKLQKITSVASQMANVMVMVQLALNGKKNIHKGRIASMITSIVANGSRMNRKAGVNLATRPA